MGQAQVPSLIADESPLGSVVCTGLRPIKYHIRFNPSTTTTAADLMQSSCASRTDSPSRIPRLRGASNTSARKYSQSQERGRTPSLGDQPSMPKVCGGGLSVPPGRTVPHERSPLSRSARASGAVGRPRTPSRQWPSRDLGFPAGAARPITPSRASSRMFTASHGTYHRHYSDKYQKMGTTRVALNLSQTVGYEVGRRVPRRSIGYRAPASPDLLAVLVTLLVRALGK